MTESDFLSKAKQALIGGARLIQYRDKSNDTEKRLRQATALKELCEQNGSLFIINDDIELTHMGLSRKIYFNKSEFQRIYKFE